MKRILPILLCTIGFLAFAAVAFASSTRNTPRKNAAVTVTCNASQLRVRIDPKFSDAAMGGQRGDRFVVTNISRRTCSVNGQPGIMLLDRRGRWIGSVFKAIVGDEVKLRPGGKATFEIGYHSCQVVAQLSDRDPKKCKFSSTIQIRFADIKGVFTLREQIDAEDGIEQVFDLEVWKRDDQ